MVIFEQSNHTSTYTGTETAADVNPSNAFAVTLRASFISYAKSFSYTGSAQTWTVPYDGYYKVELWGAMGNYDGSQTLYDINLGHGAYVFGKILLSKNTIAYFLQLKKNKTYINKEMYTAIMIILCHGHNTIILIMK